MDENELKHWGILNMHWGVRRFQNEDGSLTEAGRERYGVGPAKVNKGIAGIANSDFGKKKQNKKVNRKNIKPEDLSDDELKKITSRIYTEMNYLQARNRYLEEEARYARLTAKPDAFRGVKQFLSKVLGQPIENAMQKNIEFAIGAAGAAFLEESGSKYASDYVNYMLRGGGKKKNKNRRPNDRDEDDND